MKTPLARLIVPLVALLFTASAAGAKPPQEGPTEGSATLDGSWLGEAHHNDQTGHMLLDFQQHPEAGLVARLSFPDLHAWDIGAVPVKIDGARLTLASWSLERDGDTLVGNLPAFFVPVHEIPVVFRRVENYRRAEQPELVAPVAEPVWTREMGAPVWAGLGAWNDLLFVGDDDGVLSALDLESGETRWSETTGGAVRAVPTVVNGSLYVHSDDGLLRALDPATGEIRWQAELGEVTRIPAGATGARYNHFASSVAATDGSLYVGPFGGELIALDEATGDVRWRFAAEDTIAGTPALIAGMVVFGSFDGHVYALDAASGKEVWRHDTGAAIVSSPAVHDGLVVIGSRSYDLVALRADTGEPAWSYYYWFSWIESSVTQRDGVGYVGSSDGQELLAIDLASGEPRWTFDTHGSAWPRPAVTADSVFIGTVGVADYWAGHEGAFLAVDRATGEPLWMYPQEQPEGLTTWGFAASPVAVGDLVFTADLSGRVFAFHQEPSEDH